MLKEKVQNALNKQLNDELNSSYTYLAMSAHFSSHNFDGFAHWLKLQSEEEYKHAIKIFDYIHNRDGRAGLLKINSPKAEWKSPFDVFKDAYDQEVFVSKSIDEVVELALTEKDHATFNFMQWFVSEQVEEESTALKIVDRLKLIGDNSNGLFLLDRELGMRAASA